MSSGVGDRALEATRNVLDWFGEGLTATLAHLPGAAVSTGILVSPPEERREYDPETRVTSVVSEVIVAGDDAALQAVPKPGDLLTINGHQARLRPGSGPVYVGARVAFYVLRWGG